MAKTRKMTKNQNKTKKAIPKLKKIDRTQELLSLCKPCSVQLTRLVWPEKQKKGKLFENNRYLYLLTNICFEQMKLS